MRKLLKESKGIWGSLVILIAGVALSTYENHAIQFLTGMMVGLAMVFLVIKMIGMFNHSFKRDIEKHMKDERAIHLYAVGAQISWLLTICLLAVLAICLPNTELLLLIITFMSLSWAITVVILRDVL